MNTTTAHARTAAIWITRIAYAIAVIGVVASYGTQVTLLAANNVGTFSFIIPATIDLLAIASTMALQLPNLDATSRKIAGGILVATVGVSITANVAGGTNTIERLAHAWPVLAYLAGELLANRVRAYAARLEAAAEAAARRSQAAKNGAATRAKRKPARRPSTKTASALRNATVTALPTHHLHPVRNAA